IRAHRLAEADGALASAVSATGMTRWGADIERLRGDILTLQSHADLAGAESAYRSGLAIAERHGARSLVLKAGVSLSRLLRRMDRPREAREILELCLTQLPDGFDSAEAQSASAAMSELAGAP